MTVVAAPLSLISIQVGPQSWLDRTLSEWWDWPHTDPHAQLTTGDGYSAEYVSTPCGKVWIFCISHPVASVEEMFAADR